MNRADTLALCWRVERRDGGGLALTSHDQPVTVDGIVYEPAPGLLPASIRRRGGLDPGSADIDGAIATDALTAVDLESGRWSGASINLQAAAWDDPTRPPILLMQGEIGEVSVQGGAFSAELIGPAAVLDEPVCPSTSSECRADLGDRRCGVNIAGRRRRAIVTALEGDRLTVSPPPVAAEASGRVVILDGVCSSWSSPIAAVEDGQIVLRDVPRFAVEAGARVWIDEGCDKRFETCRSRFGNQLNFRGEPHLPGNDLLTRYPGG